MSDSQEACVAIRSHESCNGHGDDEEGPHPFLCDLFQRSFREDATITFNGVDGFAVDEFGAKTRTHSADALDNSSSSDFHHVGMSLHQAKLLINAQTSERRASSARRAILRALDEGRARLVVESSSALLSAYPHPDVLRGSLEDLHPILHRRRSGERRSFQEEILEEVRSWANLVCGQWSSSTCRWSQVPCIVVKNVTMCLLPREVSLAIPL
eukprot:TRINITY_DN18935_c0_g2_i1.p1 TRINITY_DN18935_c0_g2~~TRINITY_DN18935_c0_g2_i1.p1  ORF type:complete len:212 (-),score=15.64 TRINITY_DN18935_c0_g2_i1:16-651(-)